MVQTIDLFKQLLSVEVQVLDLGYTVVETAFVLLALLGREVGHAFVLLDFQLEDAKSFNLVLALVLHDLQILNEFLLCCL